MHEPLSAGGSGINGLQSRDREMGKQQDGRLDDAQVRDSGDGPGPRIFVRS